jgi:site-specific DNA recombinase
VGACGGTENSTEAHQGGTREQCGIAATIDVAKIDALAPLMNEKLDSGDINTRTSVPSSTSSKWIIGSNNVLQTASAGKQTENGNVRGFVRKWCARRDSNSCAPDS